MTTAMNDSIERMRVSPAQRTASAWRCITLKLLALIFLPLATSAFAQKDGTRHAANSNANPPWISEVFAATIAYVPDPSFQSGLFGLDHFADSNSLDQVGLVTAQLANGDMVVAGLVPDGASGGYCGDGTKLCSIGLVRYNAAGQRLAWPNAGVNGRYSNNYVVFPGAMGSLRFQYLRDVNVRGNVIDVLVDSPDADHPALTLGHRNVRVYSFRDDGSTLSNFPVFGDTFGAAGDIEDFYGAQMVQIDSTTMIIAATAYDSVGSYIAVTRLGILGNGLMSYDTSWGTGYGDNNSFNRLTRYFAPGNFCSGNPARCNATASYVVKPAGSTSTDFYVGGNLLYFGVNWDVVTLKVSSVTGARKAEFGGNGWVVDFFDDLEGTLKDLAGGLYVYQDDVYVAAQVARKCHDGIGLAKRDGSTGLTIAPFGQFLFGGQGNEPACDLNRRASVPFAISATGGRIGIVGYNRSRNILGGGFSVNPMLAVVDAVDRTLLHFDSHPVTRADGTRYGDAIGFDIYGGTSQNSPFTVAGHGRDESAGNALSYLVGRLVPLADGIFANGFEN